MQFTRKICELVNDLEENACINQNYKKVNYYKYKLIITSGI